MELNNNNNVRLLLEKRVIEPYIVNYSKVHGCITWL